MGISKAAVIEVALREIAARRMMIGVKNEAIMDLASRVLEARNGR
jgi:hypothetical protein